MDNQDLYKEDDERIIKLENAFKDKRDFYLKEIHQLILSSSDFDRIPELQVLMLSLRHQLIDYLSSDLAKASIQAKNAYEKIKKKILIDIKTKSSIKYGTDKERFIAIESDSRLFKGLLELVDFQINFVKENVKLLDNLAYAIKNNIEIYKFHHGE